MKNLTLAFCLAALPFCWTGLLAQNVTQQSESPVQTIQASEPTVSDQSGEGADSGNQTSTNINENSTVSVVQPFNQDTNTNARDNPHTAIDISDAPDQFGKAVSNTPKGWNFWAPIIIAGLSALFAGLSALFAGCSFWVVRKQISLNTRQVGLIEKQVSLIEKQVSLNEKQATINSVTSDMQVKMARLNQTKLQLETLYRAGSQGLTTESFFFSLDEMNEDSELRMEFIADQICRKDDPRRDWVEYLVKKWFHLEKDLEKLAEDFKCQNLSEARPTKLHSDSQTV